MAAETNPSPPSAFTVYTYIGLALTGGWLLGVYSALNANYYMFAMGLVVLWIMWAVV